MSRRIWVDVGDLLGYAGVFRRPSGIQRVVFELGQALAAMDPAGARVRFVRAGRGGFVDVDWLRVATLFAGLTEASPDPAPPAPAASRLTQSWRLQRAAWGALLDLARSLGPEPDIAGCTPSDMQPGDVLFLAGAGWSNGGHVERVATAKRQRGVQVALLVYDIIPLLRPEWFDALAVARFRAWLDGTLALATPLLAISQATAADLAAYRRKLGLPDRPVGVVRLGDGFSQPAGSGAAECIADRVAEIPRPYALCVSTIEIRKNHALLFEVWRRLLARWPRGKVPALVFAGREGALTGDLMAQLRATSCLDGAIVLRHVAGDADLEALYRSCSFTIFPSLYEGWGLPVTESLGFGKPCLASHASSVPEAGGGLARYFDPLDAGSALRQVEALLCDPAGLAAWEAEIRRDFHPVPWSRTAEMVLAGLA